MSDAGNAPGHAPNDLTQLSEPFRYPQDQVAAIVDSADRLVDAVGTLTERGFLESEVTVLAGPQEAERLAASTGRTGLVHRVLHIGNSLGLPLKELEVKQRFEQALREDGHVVFVLAPTEERKRLAADILGSFGGHFIKYFGRFTIEVL